MKQPQLLYYNMTPNVTAFSSTRHGGYGTGNYGEFNVNSYCGDNLDTVKANRKILCKELAIGDDRLFIPHQVHGTNHLAINDEFLLLSDKDKALRLDGIDILLTDKRDICIAVSTADCVPVLLYSPDRQIAAAVHAGWRGTLKRVVQEAAKFMIDRHKASPDALRIVIGPSISINAFEVGDEVFDAFRHEGFHMNDIAAKIEGKWHIDLWKANYQQLEALNVSENNIFTAGICTYDNSVDFFSARRLGINSGRIVSGIILRTP